MQLHPQLRLPLCLPYAGSEGSGSPFPAPAPEQSNGGGDSGSSSPPSDNGGSQLGGEPRQPAAVRLFAALLPALWMLHQAACVCGAPYAGRLLYCRFAGKPWFPAVFPAVCNKDTCSSVGEGQRLAKQDTYYYTKVRLLARRWVALSLHVQAHRMLLSRLLCSRTAQARVAEVA